MYEGFAGLYDRLMDDVDYDLWASYLDRLIKKYEKETGFTKSVLDCACGTGSVTVRLEKLGYHTTGLDLSAEMLEIAQQKMRKNGLRIPFICMDMQNIALHRPVEAVTCCCDGVNYLLSDAEAGAFFSSANRVLQPGGLLLFDLSTEFKLKNILGNSVMGEDRKECTYLWENHMDEQSGLLEMDLHFFVKRPDGAYDRIDENQIQRAYREEDIRKLLRKNGFEVLGIFDAFTEKPVNGESQRMQFAARKVL